MTGEQHRQRECAVQPLQRGLGRRDRAQTAGQVVADQLRHHLGVGLGGKAVALGGQLVAQALEILDDAVVNDRHTTRLVRVGIVLGRRTMGRPTGVADSDHPGERLNLEGALQIGELALGAAALDPPVDQGRHSGAVVAPVFQALQRVEQQGGGRLAAENADDAAHRGRSPVRAGLRSGAPAGANPRRAVGDIGLARPSDAEAARAARRG